MIRVVTLEELDPALVTRVCKALNAAFGVGAEFQRAVPVTSHVGSGAAIDAAKLLAEPDPIKIFANDKLFYVTREPLAPRQLPSGKLGTQGLALFGGARAVVSTAGLGKGDDLLRKLAKHAVHQAGHLWELHHCLDARCSMFPTWTEPFAAGDPLLCSFCRDKSERKMQASA